MMTTKLYQIDTYLKQWDARILAAKPSADGDCLIQLDQTVTVSRRFCSKDAGIPLFEICVDLV